MQFRVDVVISSAGLMVRLVTSHGIWAMEVFASRLIFFRTQCKSNLSTHTRIHAVKYDFPHRIQFISFM